jgi:phosphoglycolate phosphatase
MPELLSHLPQAIFFDLDGTLLDSLPGIMFSIEEAFAACGIAMQPIDLRRAIGPPIRTILAHAATQTATSSDLDLLESAFRSSYDSQGWQKTLLFPDSDSALREAHSLGVQLFVVSNKPRHISIKILEREGLAHLFDSIVTRDTSNPPYTGKAGMIDHLLQAFQLDPVRCIMVGDTEEDACAAAATQVPFAWMTHGYGQIPLGLTVAFRINSFSELLPTLTKESAQ